MNEISGDEAARYGAEELLVPYTPGNAAYGEASDADAQDFLQMVQEQNGLPTESELQEQFDKNFQNFSYLFLKGVFGYVEEEMKRQQ